MFERKTLGNASDPPAWSKRR